jgi:serine carboxypeptidase S28
MDLTPSSTPWIIVGCSYSGARAAISRSRYPDTFFAAYAASAPVQFQVELDTFFDPVYHKMVAKGYGNCTQDLHAAMKYVDLQLSDSQNVSSTKQRFLGPGAESNNNGDFTLAIANIYSSFQSHGITGGTHSLASLCDYLERDPISNRTAGLNGLVSHYGVQFVAERLASWPDLLPIVNGHFNTNCRGMNESIPPSCDLAQPASAVAGISWTWQLCSELGLFTTQNSGPHSLVSQYQNLEYRWSLCTRQFPEGLASELLHVPPSVDRINRDTGGRSMRPSNVFWTAGQYDPWRSLSPLATEGRISEQSSVTVSQDVPACNVTTGKDTLFGYLIKDAEHCFDYAMDSEPAAVARGYFVKALWEWLPCFQGSGDRATSNKNT